MKRLIPAIAIIFGYASAALAGESVALTALHAIRALSNSEASKELPVAFEATVTYYRGFENTLFVQDGSDVIYVSAPVDAKLVPGDRILIQGKTLNSFNPIVTADRITFLRHEDLPKAKPATFAQMISAETDCRLVTVRGVVRAADFMATPRYANLQVLMDGGYFDVTIDGDYAKALEGLLDAEVEITGVYGEKFDSKMQVTGILLHVQSIAGIKVLKRAGVSPWSLPLTPMDRILAVYHVLDTTPRVRVHGVITYYAPGAAVLLQDGARSIWITTQTRSPLRVGDVADAVGFPDVHDGFLNLLHGEIHDTLRQAPIPPLPATWESLSPHGSKPSGHHYDLVSIEGQVVTQVQEALQDEYVLAVNGKLFSAIYRHLDGLPPSYKQIPLGSKVLVTGICVLENSNPFATQASFSILIRSPEDIVIVANPSLLNTRNLILAVTLLLLAVFAIAARGWSLERKVRGQTAQMSARTEAEAALERQRSSILEDINGSRPLGEVLEKIAEMVSSMLGNAPCWCELTDGANYGNDLQEPHNLRVVHANIHVRSGPALGALFAALDPAIETSDSEALALNNGTRLAALAIETRRLYSDLRRRSEFDLLTDIHNRFSLDKRLDILIEESRIEDRVFGLIYIDLDKFKPINDLYGHHVGDLFLQEVAVRMKRQLRGGDMLARLGGDEFAALVSEAKNRAGVEEVKLRLERCFDEPFFVDGHLLQGAASFGIALYPEDGTSRDSLLTAADAAMYAVKNNKHQTMS